MKMPRLRSQFGFTLIELLVVIVIIAILAALTIGATKYAWTRAGTSRAQGEIATIETALESYKNDNGIYPLSTSTRASAINNSGLLYTALTGSSKKYFTFRPEQIKVSGGVTYIADPFGVSYNYYRNSSGTQSNAATFDLWSFGPDQQDDTGDDIVNWRR